LPFLSLFSTEVILRHLNENTNLWFFLFCYLEVLLYSHKVRKHIEALIISGVCRLGIAHYDARTEYPKIAAWIERVRHDLNPYYDEAHGILNKMAGKSKL
jgi:hypothetical protein